MRRSFGFFKDVVPYCRTRGFEYILATSADMSRWTGEEDAPAVERAMRDNPYWSGFIKLRAGLRFIALKISPMRQRGGRMGAHTNPHADAWG